MMALLLLLQELLVSSVNILKVPQLVLELLREHMVVLIEALRRWDAVEVHLLVVV